MQYTGSFVVVCTQVQVNNTCSGSYWYLVQYSEFGVSHTCTRSTGYCTCILYEVVLVCLSYVYVVLE